MLAPTRRPWTISLRRRRCAGAFFFGGGGAGRADHARPRARRDAHAPPCWSTAALAVSTHGCYGASSQGRGCSPSSVSRPVRPRGYPQRVWQCGVWCGARSPSLMGGMAWGAPSLGPVSLRSRQVDAVTARPSAGLRRPSGSAQAREGGALGGGTVMLSSVRNPRIRRYER